MVEEIGSLHLFCPRSTADNDNRRFFRIGLGCGVGDFQCPDTIGHAHCPKTAHPGIGIGRKSRPLLIGGVDEAQLPALFEHVVESQDIISRNSEDVPDAVFRELPDQVLSDFYL